MLKSSLKILGIIFLVYLISGCTVRTYTQVKDRVDQDASSGNAGYLYGTPSPQDRSQIRKTRKTYVLEIETKNKEPEAKPQSKGNVHVSEESSFRRSYRSEPVYQEPYVSSERTGPSTSEYTVEKGDTLQKISKKFYDTYRKWNVIYEVNQDKISDPNRIKPGVVLTIPQ